MIRLKHIVSILLLAVTTLVAAQESYVIDSVCVGAERLYRRDGEKLYTYDWFIRDTSGTNVASPFGVEFIEVNAPGDTVWGNEIQYLWDVVGEFDIEVQVFSEHGCDTLDQGRVKVFEEPSVYAGEDLVLCTSLEEITLSSDTAWNYSVLIWTSTGDGSFSSEYNLHPTYFMGPSDTGGVTLILRGEGFADNGTCEPAVDSVTYFFSKPDISFTVNELLCYNDSNASIQAFVAGGLEPYTYEWEGPSGFVSVNSDSIGGLWAGTYILTVTDANLCVDTDTVELINPPELLVYVDSVQHVSCYGYADGFIWASAEGGTGGLSFAWSGPSGFSSTDDSIYSISGGIYVLTVTDENGCVFIDSVVVEEPDPLIALIDSAIDVQCYGYNNGAAHVTVTDGTGPYGYSWNTIPEQDSVWAVDLSPGEYIVTITDLNGCMAWDTVVINEPPPLAILADSLDARCDGGKPGEIHLEVSGGNQLANAPFYYFEWRNETDSLIATTKDVSGLAGNQYYTVLVSDSLGCKLTRQVFINEIPMMEHQVSIDSALCYGDPWNVDVTVSKGRPPYHYLWADTSGVFTDTTQDLINVPGAYYTLTIYDSDSCEIYQEFDLKEPPLLLAEIDAIDSLLCVGDAVLLQGNTIGGTGALTYSWTGNGSAYLNNTFSRNVVFGGDAPGNYQLIYTIVDEANCDAADTFEINVYPPTYSYDSIEVCMGDAPFLWNSRTILSDADGIYRDTLVNQWGCDSLLTLKVDVLFPEFLDTAIYVCENEEAFVLFNHTILPDRDSIYLDTLRYVDSGCDSLLITLNVFTKPVTDTTMYAMLCSGADAFPWNNRWIQTDSSQVYLDTLVNSYGCDSLLTYDVTILPPDTFYVDTTFCRDEPEFVWNGLTILTQYDSIYEATLTNQLGCDSIVNLNVHLLPVTDTMIDTLLCYNTPAYAWNNLIIYADHDSTYLDTLVNQWGCDSLLTLNVSIIYPDTINLDTTLCEGVPEFAWNSHTVYAFNDSTYSDILVNQFGCDSIVNLDVRILIPKDSFNAVELCQNEMSFDWYGQTILPDRDSMYYDTLYYDAGCDSLRLQLEVITLPISDTLIDTVLCEGSPEFVWNSHTVSTYLDSTYLETLLNVWGCDSTITFIVDIVPTFKDTFTETICYGEPLADWYGQTISTTFDSTYIQLLPDPLGCDSLLFYEVTVLPVTDEVLDSTLCYGLPPFMWNNRLISTTADGVYLDTIQNSFGCDSLLTYNITIIPPDTFRFDTIICQSDPEFAWNGFTVSTTLETEYEANLSNAEGCDSIAIMNVILINGTSTDTTVAACEEYTWVEGTGQTYTISDTYIHTIGTGICADTMRLHLIISPPIVLDTIVEDVLCYGDSTGTIDLTVNGGIAPFNYIWNTGDTIQDLNNLPAGVYSVSVYDSLGCTNSISVTISEPQPIQIDLDLLTYISAPGESDGSIEVSVSGGTPGYTFSWTNQAGIEVGTSEDLFNQPAGKYTLEVTDVNSCLAIFTQTISSPLPPPATCPPDLTLTCFEELAAYPMANSYSEYLALDTLTGFNSDCGIDSSSFFKESILVAGSVFCYEQIRTYGVVDSCGDTLSCVQFVIVDDKVAPTMTCPPTLNVINDVAPPAYADTAEFLAAGGLFDDNCGVVSFRQVGTDVSNGGTDPEVITRVYEVSDYCGKTARCTQLVKIYLSDDFAIDCGGLHPESFECRADLLDKYKTLQDFRNAGGYVYSYPLALDESTFRITSSSDGKKCPEKITLTFSIENENGDPISCSKTFTIYDKTPPEFTIPDKFITCSDPMPRVYTTGQEVVLYGKGTISDNCTDMSKQWVFMSKPKILQESCPKIIERYYYVFDACDIKAEAIERIIITDEIPPEIVSEPGDIETDCYLPEPYADYSEFATAGGNVSADCGATIRMAHIDDEVLATGVINRTYRFWDNCDSVDYVQKITIDDATPPEFTQIPAPFTVDCEPVVFTSWTEFVGLGGWATDNCALDTGSFKLVSSVTSDDLCPKTYVNIYEIFDMSGNRDTMHHNVIVVDIEKPILTCPPSDTIDVTAAFPAPFETLDGFILGGGFASDNCGLDSASFTLVSSDSIIISDCESQITYTYIVADNCGNWSDECSFTLYKRDYLDPEIYCPSDVTVSCFDDAPSVYTTISEFEAAGGSISDNYLLDEASFVHFDSIVGSNCPVTIIRTYQVADICGNTVSCSYQITINDTIPPVITCPADTAIECLSDVISEITTLEEFEAAGGKLFDNCEIDPNSFTSRTEKVFTLSSTSIRNYFSISDLCGNIDSCVQVITLTDTIPPEAICNSITVQLDENGQYVLTDVDIRNISKGSNDNCTAEEDLIIEVDLLDFTCEDVEAGKQVNVVVTDEAGNSSVCMADIVVVDNIPPTAICQDITVYLDENGQVTVTGAMIDNGSFDNCKLDSIIAQPSQYDCNDVGDNPVKLIAVDAYGLRDTCEAIVTVFDEILPAITCVGKQTVQLDQNGLFDLTWEMVTDSVWDECAIDTVLLDDYQLDCDNIGITIITATAYDVNGNYSSCEIEFEVFGNVAPNVVNDSAVTAVDVPVEIPVVNNDYDLKTSINISSLGVVISPNHGSVTVDNKTGIVTYTPDPGYIGPDIFRYTICDDGIPCIPMCGEAIVFVTVRPANQPPVAIDDYFDVPCGNLFGNVLVDNGGGADSDPDGDKIVVNPIPIVRTNSGEIILYENGNFEYTPYEDFVGVDSFQYEIHDVGIPPSLYDTAWVYITRVADNDCDGIADVDDIDDDNDGIRDVNEGDLAYDSDLDGIPDSYDVDSDNDGILDNIEGQGEHNYIPPTGRDSDGDGWDDAYDPDNGGYPFDINLTDTDGDSMPDFLDIDSDNDGVFDFIEGHDENADGIADAVRIYNDSDFDGLDDAYDTQAGWAMPGNESASNAPLQDFDGDGERDWRDTNDEDDQFETNAEDINGNGDFSDDDLDLDGRPEYLDTEIDCELFIPEGFSPNDDGVHDFFQILCIYPRYPNAKMMIFNRNGQKLFEKENYGNYDVWSWDDAWWWGTSENKLTLGRSGGLPAGNYIYVLELNDGAGTVKNGTVMVAY